MSGQNVLLHAAVGGIGLAAIEWLHRTCVSAIVTAGSRCKHALLCSLGLSKMASSRDPASFAQLSALQVRGRRLDGVLSALSNEFIPVSLGLLSEYGCFQEIGKNKIWSSERAAAAIPHVDYLAVAVDEGSRNCPGWNAAPWWMQAQLQALTRHADAGLTNPLPISSFRFANEAIWSALKLLQHGRNIGKVIIVVGSKRRTAPPMLPTPPPFAVPSTSVSRAADAAACARQLSALPHDTPCLIELDDIRIDSHGNLDAIVHGRRTPVLVLCRGALAGGGAMLLLDRATVVIGDQTASIPAAADLKRLGRRCLHSGTEPSWLDFVGTAAEARTEAQHLCRRLAQLPAPLLATCHTMLPAASTDAALLAMGSLHPRAPRQPGPRLVRVSMEEGTGVAILELHDPKRFNTVTHELGEDVAHAIRLIQRHEGLRAIVLQGAGAHFCAGGNPYAAKVRMPLAALAHSLERDLSGFAELRSMPIPVTCAVHGKLIGGGNAACLNTDFIVADSAATFEHGNLVRGVCPLGGYSRTFVDVSGRSRALGLYLSNATLNATDAIAAGVAHDVCFGGVEATQRRALDIARLLAVNVELAAALVQARRMVGIEHIAAEAVGHAVCLFDGQASLQRRSEFESPSAAVPLAFTQQNMSAAVGLHAEQGELVVHSIEVPTHLGPGLSWPEGDIILVFRGLAGAEHFCLGGDPSRSRLASGSFLDGLPSFASTLEQLQQVPPRARCLPSRAHCALLRRRARPRRRACRPSPSATARRAAAGCSSPAWARSCWRIRTRHLASPRSVAARCPAW